MAFALLASPALSARGGVLPLSADDGWLQFGNFVVLLFASAALVSVCAYALRSLSRRPILFLVMFSVSSLVATIVADKTNGVYVTGTDPTNLASRLTAKIEMRDGAPVVTWEPDLNTNGVIRTYKVYGKETLDGGGEWQYPTNSLHRFFKVSVEMP